MAYPRRRPLCAAVYGRQAADDSRHATARSAPGGTPSPRRPELPERILTLVCQDCRGEYAWDSFAGRPMLETQDLPASQPYRRGGSAQRPLSLRGSQPWRS